MSGMPRISRLSRRALIGSGLLAGAAALLSACQPSSPASKPAASAPSQAPAAKPVEAAKPAEAAKPSEAAKPAAAAKRGGTLNYAEAADFTHFSPWSVTPPNQGIYNQVFNRLIRKDGAGKEEGDLAESWEMAKDGLSFKAKIKQGVKWHDGRELVAEDYVKMFGYTKDEALLKDAAVKKHQGLVAPVKEVKAADKYTVEFSFGTPVPFITDILDYWYAVRIDDPADPAFTKKPPIGTGAFKLAEWQPGQFARLPKNPDYFVKDQPVIDEMMFKRLEKAETLIPNLQSGGVDGIQVTSAADVAALKANPQVTLEVNENTGSIFDIMVNVSKPPLDKKEVRQALAYSLNRAEMAKTAFFGVSRPISSPFYNPNSMAYREDLVNAYAFDLDKAAKMLESAGAKGLELSTVVTPRWPQMKLFVLLWQADLAKIGVKLNVTEVEIAKYYDVGGDGKMQGMDFIPWLNARTTRDPAILFNTQANFRGNERNIFGYRNAELEKLIADGAVEPDPAKRKTIYQKANEIMVFDANLIYLATDPRIWAFNKSVTGVTYDLSGNMALAGASIQK
ncbi:MAG: ABC transporter substrate-binding protein [Chloroflexota bacterium]